MITTNEQCAKIQHEILTVLKTKEPDLVAIQKSTEPLATRWGQVIQLLLPIQLEVIARHGLGNDQAALSRFNNDYVRVATEEPALAALNKQKWLFIFKAAFGITSFKETSLKEAQELVSDIAAAMTAEPFLQQVDAAMAKVSQDAPLAQRRAFLLSVLFPLHMSVMEQHGFPGESGYIQAQGVIMHYYHDTAIRDRAAEAQAVLFKRAKLLGN